MSRGNPSIKFGRHSPSDYVDAPYSDADDGLGPIAFDSGMTGDVTGHFETFVPSADLLGTESVTLVEPAWYSANPNFIAPEDLPPDFVTTGGKWGPSGTFGTTGGTVTWSIAGAGLTNQTGQTFFTGSSVDLSTFLPADFVTQITNAFAAWSAVANINFVQVADGGGNFGVGTTGNIRIGGGFIDGFNPNGSTVGFTFFPPGSGGTPNAIATNGDMILDSGDAGHWDDALLAATLLHELGHALGLDHVPQNNPIAVMNPIVHIGLPLQPDDIAGIQTIYGPAAAVAGSVSINDMSITEGNFGTQTLTFTVIRTGGTAAFAVNFATANNTATAPSDYTATTGMLNFGANVNTQTISVTINGDAVVEQDETFFVNLSGATNGAAITDTQGQGTILNDDSSNNAPVITSDGGGATASKSVAENSTFVTTVTATDPDAGQTLSYAIVGGDDPARFQLNAATHVLTFIAAPDFELATDFDHNNSYIVQVRVTDNGNPNLSDTQTITVNVTDVAPVFTGGAGSDLLSGTPENDTLQGLGGDDVLIGLANNNVLDGGPGNDTANYSAAPGGISANLTINTGSNGYGGTDTYISIENLVGTAFGDFLIGNGLANTLNGLGGADNMAGAAGDDVYIVDNGGDLVTENANEGTDTVYSSINYTLPANVEILILQGAAAQGYGNASANTLYGTVGDNLLDGQGGADIMAGFAGNDLYYVDNAGDGLIENANEGNDTVFSTVSMTLGANVENLILQGFADLQGYGNTLVNTIYGNGGNNLLNGNAGADLMVGGAGNDTYFVDNSGDACFEVAAQGIDSVFSTASYGLAADVENLILQGFADLQGYGNAGANTIYGNNGNNLLNGGAGADLMVGGAGNDVYYADNAGDSAFESAAQGIDSVFSTANYGLAADVENLILQGSADLQGYGSAGANVIYGNTGNNLLNGGAGADQMVGGAGNDIYYVDNIGDTVFESAGQGNDTVFSSVDYALSANVENLILQGAANVNGYGNSQANTIYGNAGINNLDGGTGADILTGNAGNDVFVFHPGEANGDTIADFTGAGNTAGDLIHFTGYGAGATFTFVDATHWQVNYGGFHDIVQFQNAVGAAINATDYAFV